MLTPSKPANAAWDNLRFSRIILGSEGAASSVVRSCILPFLNFRISPRPVNISVPMSRFFTIYGLCNLFKNMARYGSSLRFTIKSWHPNFMIRFLPVIHNPNATAFPFPLSRPPDLPDTSGTPYNGSRVGLLKKIELKRSVVIV